MGTLEHPHPEGLLHNPAFSQVVAASGRRTIYTAGQVSIDERGALVGAADLAAQTAQAMRNVRTGAFRRRRELCRHREDHHVRRKL